MHESRSDVKSYHLLRTTKKGWILRRGENGHVVKQHPNKLWLTDFAESFCRTHECELVVHKMNGEIDYRRRFPGSGTGADGPPSGRPG